MNEQCYGRIQYDTGATAAYCELERGHHGPCTGLVVAVKIIKPDGKIGKITWTNKE